jgi:putative transposase
VGDWPHSSFHVYVRRGIYPANWACEPSGTIDGGE